MKPLVKQVLQASVVICKRLVQIFDHVFHFHASNLPQPLGHPLSNQKIYENFKDGKIMWQSRLGSVSIWDWPPSQGIAK
ncbi:MAG TPA: hypothetical protein VMR33_08225 [Candidatus Baltobacteraceae bacterium]|jgi:hypothetical protein|nr:hypothetical protein [Candidatus Baltobacteraceae bacterium]